VDAPADSVASNSTGSSSSNNNNNSNGSLLVESREKWKLELQLDQVGISIVNEKPEELLYLSLDEFRVEYVDYGSKRSFEFDIKDCQIDNQLATTYFPVLLYSTTKEPPEFFKLSVIQSLEHPDIAYYNYISLLCREFFIQIDEELLIKLLAFIDVTIETLLQQGNNSNSSSGNSGGIGGGGGGSDNGGSSSGVSGGDADILGHKFSVMAVGGDDDTSRVIYNELFHINPFKVNLTFLGHGRDEHDPNNRTNLTSALLAIPEKLVPSVENVPIGLKGLLLRHSFSTTSEMMQRISEHYKRQLTQEHVSHAMPYSFYTYPC
jgi:vacuolar protein sorting-associated protein 13A/C